MATLTLTLVTGVTNARTATFSAPDATRIFAAWQASVNPSGTQADFVDWLAQKMKVEFIRLVKEVETVAPTKPVITVA